MIKFTILEDSHWNLLNLDVWNAVFVFGFLFLIKMLHDCWWFLQWSRDREFAREVGIVLRMCAAEVRLIACPSAYYLQKRFLSDIFTLEEIKRNSGNGKWFLKNWHDIFCIDWRSKMWVLINLKWCLCVFLFQCFLGGKLRKCWSQQYSCCQLLWLPTPVQILWIDVTNGTGCDFQQRTTYRCSCRINYQNPITNVATQLQELF